MLAFHAERLSGSLADPDVRPQVAVSARQSLLRDPTSASAAVSLALIAEIEGRKSQASGLINYALRMSRRDLRAHLWSIEAAVARHNVPIALHHYDIALRTSKSAPGLLFPVLSAALSDPAIRNGVAGVLNARPAWKDLFLNWLSSNSSDPRSAAMLFLNLTRRGVDIPWTAQASLTGALVRQGAFAEAWQTYALSSATGDRRRSRQAAFDNVPEVPSPFDWNLPAVDGLSASLQQGPHGIVLAYDAANGAGGVAARQLQFLPAGQYIIRGKASDVTGDVRPFWQLVCADGTELGRVILPTGTASFVGSVNVPTTCPVQWFNLSMPLVDSPEPVNGMIDRAVIEPVTARPAGRIS